jgi:hypothetical protein
MIKTNIILATLLFTVVTGYSQSVVTFAGKANDDIFTKYESTSGTSLTNTYFASPNGICFDNNGKMYVSELNKVRVVTNNLLYIRAGSLQSTALSEGYKDGTGTQATFRNPKGLESDASGNIYVADADNHCIRKVSAYGSLGSGQIVTTFAGAATTTGLPGYGTSGSSNGTGTNAKFNTPTDITRDSEGSFYVTDQNNSTIRKISSSGEVTTLAGFAMTKGTADGVGSTARFGLPWGVAIYSTNQIVVTDRWNGNIRLINIYSGETTTLTGSKTGPNPQHVDGTLSEARFRAPTGVAVVNGIIYVNDYNVIRAINVANNSVTTFAGDVSIAGIADGTGSNANFTELAGMESDGQGNLYVTENSLFTASHLIRKVTINSLAPGADFTATKNNILTNQTVTLRDISTGQAATIRSWVITPSTYSISAGSLSNDTLDLSFSVAGFYNVQLTITNNFGTDVKNAENYFIVSTTGAVKQYQDADFVTLYPNPAASTVTLASNGLFNLNNAIVQLYAIEGKQIGILEPGEPFSISELPNGTYFITVTGDDIQVAKKLIVNHE